MAQTVVDLNSPMRVKLYSRAVFAELYQPVTLTNNLVGKVPQESEARLKLEKGQGPKDMPIVQIRDLSKSAGDTVTMDTFNILSGLPITGDTKIQQGGLMGLTSSTQEIRIDQSRGGFDAGGRMTQQRTVDNLRTLGKAALVGWEQRRLEQIRLTHMAGARGHVDNEQWVVPLADNPAFNGIVVNPVNAPTYTRALCVDGTDGNLIQSDVAWYTTDVANTDKMTLNTVNQLKRVLEETTVPLQNIRLPGDVASGMNPLAMLLVTPAQWAEMWHSSEGSKDWETFLAQARERSKTNPLYIGEDVGLWNGILVRKYLYPIRFDWDADLQIATNADDHTEQTVTIKNAVVGKNGKPGYIDRAMLIGAQALGEAWGKHSGSGQHYNWYECQPEADHGATFEASIWCVGGTSKVTFKAKDKKDYDHGVYAIDSFVEAL